MGLNEQDFRLIREMRGQGLLQDIDIGRLSDVREQTVLIACSDCHQREDLDGHLEWVVRKITTNPLIHPFRLHGLAFRLAPSLVTERFHEDEMMMGEIEEAIQLDKLRRRVMIVGHMPCGKARKHGLSLFDCIELYVRGRQNIRTRFPQLTVSCHLHVDYTDSPQRELSKRTYHIETSLWPKYAAELAQYDHTQSPIFNQSYSTPA